MLLILNQETVTIEAHSRAKQSGDEIAFDYNLYEIVLGDSTLRVDGYTWRLWKQTEAFHEDHTKYGKRYWIKWECYKEIDNMQRYITTVIHDYEPTVMQTQHDTTYYTYIFSEAEAIKLYKWLENYAQTTDD